MTNIKTTQLRGVVQYLELAKDALKAAELDESIWTWDIDDFIYDIEDEIQRIKDEE